MKMKKIRRLGAFLLCVLLVAAMALPALAYSRSVGASGVISMDASSDGSTIYVQFDGDSWYIQSDMVFFSYGDGTAETYKLEAGSNGAALYNMNWQQVASGSVTYTEGSHFEATLNIPVSVLHSDDFVMTMGGASVSSSELGIASSQPAAEPDPQPTPTPEPEEDPSSQPEEEPTPEPSAEPTEEPAAATGDLVPTATGLIVVDGDVSDWKGVSGLTPASAYNEVKIARDTAGNVYLALTGTATTEWDSAAIWNNLTVTQNGASVTGQFAQLGNGESWAIPGSYVYNNTANHNTSAPFYLEAMIPASYFTDPNFNISVGVADFDAGEIPVVDGTPYVEDDTPAVYNGIVIDGDFSDWAAVTKRDVTGKDPNGTLKNAAMIFDGDTIYIYLEEQDHAQAGGAGSHSNGKMTLLTDLHPNGGSLFTIYWDSETVDGPAGTLCKRTGNKWEIAIPASYLKTYMNTISLALYQGEVLVADVANLDGSTGGEYSSDIVYDGNYGDWANYPHQLIQYDTAGTQNNVIDGEGALYSTGSSVLGHVYTNAPDHLAEAGGEFTSAVVIRFNSSDSKTLEFRYATVDGAGNINWNPDRLGLADGTYEYYLFDTQVWGTSQNISDLVPADICLGKMMITIRGGVEDECEFIMDLEEAAKYEKLGFSSASDIKTVEAKFGRIGQEWLITAGSSSGPWLGVALSAMVAAGVWLWHRRRDGAKVVAG